MKDAVSAPSSRLPADAFVRAGVIIAISAGVGLLVNAFSRHPVPILDPLGPGYRAPAAASISTNDLRIAMDTGMAVLLDARSESEYRSARPAHAWRVTLDGFLEEYARIKPFLAEKQVLIVLCDTDACPTGNSIVKWLNRLGHDNARVVAGGWEAYRKAGLAVADPTP